MKLENRKYANNAKNLGCKKNTKIVKRVSETHIQVHILHFQLSIFQ